LINNVGIGKAGAFCDFTDHFYLNFFTLNCITMTFLTKRLLPLLANREQKSAIINVGSFTGIIPTPYCTIYSATKAFSNFFSKALGEEVKNKIDVLSFTPLFVDTKMTTTVPKKFKLSPEECVTGCLSALVVGRNTTAGSWKHEYLSVLFLYYTSNNFLFYFYLY